MFWTILALIAVFALGTAAGIVLDRKTLGWRLATGGWRVLGVRAIRDSGD
jgi:hypothetical protein